MIDKIDLKIICKFSQMEFKYGEAERGRTLFEGIVSHHPKRLDMWSVYLDMEIRNGDIDITRYGYISLFFFYCYPRQLIIVVDDSLKELLPLNSHLKR
jgi:hypothetical protein